MGRLRTRRSRLVVRDRRLTRRFGDVNVHVRPDRPTDAARCCDIVNEAIRAMDGLNDAARAHVRARSVPDRLGPELERWTTLVVESDDRIVGLGTLDDDDVKRVSIDPAGRGGGAATALMRSLEEIAARRVGTIRLEASPSSVAFSESLGFVRLSNDIGVPDRAERS